MPVISKHTLNITLLTHIRRSHSKSFAGKSTDWNSESTVFIRVKRANILPKKNSKFWVRVIEKSDVTRIDEPLRCSKMFVTTIFSLSREKLKTVLYRVVFET